MRNWPISKLRLRLLWLTMPGLSLLWLSACGGAGINLISPEARSIHLSAPDIVFEVRNLENTVVTPPPKISAVLNGENVSNALQYNEQTGQVVLPGGIAANHIRKGLNFFSITSPALYETTFHIDADGPQVSIYDVHEEGTNAVIKGLVMDDSTITRFDVSGSFAGAEPILLPCPTEIIITTPNCQAFSLRIPIMAEHELTFNTQDINGFSNSITFEKNTQNRLEQISSLRIGNGALAIANEIPQSSFERDGDLPISQIIESLDPFIEQSIGPIRVKIKILESEVINLQPEYVRLSGKNNQLLDIKTTMERIDALSQIQLSLANIEIFNDKVPLKISNLLSDVSVNMDLNTDGEIDMTRTEISDISIGQVQVALPELQPIINIPLIGNLSQIPNDLTNDITNLIVDQLTSNPVLINQIAAAPAAEIIKKLLEEIPTNVQVTEPLSDQTEVSVEVDGMLTQLIKEDEFMITNIDANTKIQLISSADTPMLNFERANTQADLLGNIIGNPAPVPPTLSRAGIKHDVTGSISMDFINNMVLQTFLSGALDIGIEINASELSKINPVQLAGLDNGDLLIKVSSKACPIIDFKDLAGAKGDVTAYGLIINVQSRNPQGDWSLFAEIITDAIVNFDISPNGNKLALQTNSDKTYVTVHDISFQNPLAQNATSVIKHEFINRVSNFAIIELFKRLTLPIQEFELPAFAGATFALEDLWIQPGQETLYFGGTPVIKQTPL